MNNAPYSRARYLRWNGLLFSFITMLCLSLSVVACSDPYAGSDPEVGVPDARYFMLAASANKSVRHGSEFLGGFTEFDQLDYEDTIKNLSEKYHIHSLSEIEKKQVAQLYQDSIARFAPWDWPSKIDITAATVVDSPANYLIFFVKSTDSAGRSSLRLIRIQDGLNAYKPPVFVYGYTEESLPKEGLENPILHSLKLDQRLPESAFVAGNSNDSSSDFSRYRYTLIAEQACSHRRSNRANMGELSLAVSSIGNDRKSQQSEQIEPYEKLLQLVKLPIAEDELPCWENHGNDRLPVARRRINVKTDYLTPEGVLLRVTLARDTSSSFKGKFEIASMYFIWCANSVDCHLMMPKIEVKYGNSDTIYEDRSENQRSFSVGETMHGETAFQVWNYHKQLVYSQNESEHVYAQANANTEQTESFCRRVKIEPEWIMSRHGIKLSKFPSVLKKVQPVFDYIVDDQIAVVRKRNVIDFLVGLDVTNVCME